MLWSWSRRRLPWTFWWPRMFESQAVAYIYFDTPVFGLTPLPARPTRRQRQHAPTAVPGTAGNPLTPRRQSPAVAPVVASHLDEEAGHARVSLRAPCSRIAIARVRLMCAVRSRCCLSDGTPEGCAWRAQFFQRRGRTSSLGGLRHVVAAPPSGRQAAPPERRGEESAAARAASRARMRPSGSLARRCRLLMRACSRSCRRARIRRARLARRLRAKETA